MIWCRKKQLQNSAREQIANKSRIFWLFRTHYAHSCKYSFGESPSQTDAAQRAGEPVKGRQEPLAIESGKSLSLMLEQYADCLPSEYIRQWREQYGTRKKSETGFSLCGSLYFSFLFFLVYTRIAYTCLREFYNCI